MDTSISLITAFSMLLIQRFITLSLGDLLLKILRANTGDLRRQSTVRKQSNGARVHQTTQTGNGCTRKSYHYHSSVVFAALPMTWRSLTSNLSHCRMSFPMLGLDVTNRVYDIKPKPRGNLPFDFNGYGRIDLIVAQVGLSASDLLDGFDLEICKASFDGKKFHIPDPHLTFAAKTKMEPYRRAVVGSYVTHHRKPEAYCESIEFSRLASSTISAVRRDVPNTPFYRRLDIADRLPDRYNPNADILDLQGTFQDPTVLMKHGAPIQFHNWCCAPSSSVYASIRSVGLRSSMLLRLQMIFKSTSSASWHMVAN
jgi:hypothetical protein